MGPTLQNIFYSRVRFQIDEFFSYTNKSIELVSYTDDLCISFSIDRYYDFKLIEVVCKQLESVIDELGPTFSAPECQFIAFGDQKIVKEVESLRLVSGQKNPHTKQLKYLGLILHHQLSFLPHVKYIHKIFDGVYDKQRRLQPNTFGLRHKERVIWCRG